MDPDQPATRGQPRGVPYPDPSQGLLKPRRGGHGGPRILWGLELSRNLTPGEAAGLWPGLLILLKWKQFLPVNLLEFSAHFAFASWCIWPRPHFPLWDKEGSKWSGLQVEKQGKLALLR